MAIAGDVKMYNDSFGYLIANTLQGYPWPEYAILRTTNNGFVNSDTTKLKTDSTFATLKVYPNPSSNGDYIIEVPDDIAVSSNFILTVYDDKGSTVMLNEYTDYRNKISLSLVTFAKCLYLIRLNTDAKSYSAKLVRK